MLSRINTYGGLHTTLLQLEPEATRRPLLRDVDIVAYKHSFFGKTSNHRKIHNSYLTISKVRVSSDIAQDPIFTIAQSGITIDSLADLFNETPSQLLLEAPSHSAINARRQLIHIFTTAYGQVLVHTAE